MCVTCLNYPRKVVDIVSILILGGAGYIGSHVVQAMNDRYQVIVVDNLVKGHKPAVSGAKLIIEDIRNKEAMKTILVEYGVEAVIHFAADSQVGESMQEPAKYYNNNVYGTLSLLEAMLDSGVKKIVFSSTAAVYGEPDSWPIPEDQVTCPTSVYGRTKLVIEHMLNDFSQAYGLQYVALRYFNAAGASLDGSIGEDHNPETHLIPLILATALGKRQAIDVYGTDYPTPDGTCIRDYIHVCDLADAHILALKHLLDGGRSAIYNLGSQTGFSVREVINKVKEVAGVAFPVNEVPRRSGDPAVLVASSEKICRELGWKPKCSDLGTIIKTAWDWHRNNPDGFRE